MSDFSMRSAGSLARKLVTALGCVSLIVAAACGDDTEELPGVTLDSYASLFKEGQCKHLVNCYFMPDQATCMQIVGTDPGVIQSVASAQAGLLTYDPAAARACIDAMASYACDGDVLFPRALRETCDKVFGGRFEEGASCFHAAECSGLDAICEGSCGDQCCQGTCRLAAATAALGETCDGTISCQEGLFCGVDMMGARLCEPKPGAGEDCSASSGCQFGFACDPGTQTCFKQAESGAPCNPDLAADGCLHIVEYCHVESRTCVPYPEPGQPCGSNAFAPELCAAYATCLMGMCVARPVLGEACPQGSCMGQGQEGYGFVPLLECSGSGTCDSVGVSSSCVQ